MLDKSIAYKNMIMRAEGLNHAFAGSLPDGYCIRAYTPGDEDMWAMIETSVGEFDTEAKAREYFVQTYLPFPDEIARRCFFCHCSRRGIRRHLHRLVYAGRSQRNRRYPLVWRTA